MQNVLGDIGTYWNTPVSGIGIKASLREAINREVSLFSSCRRQRRSFGPCHGNVCASYSAPIRSTSCSRTCQTLRRCLPMCGFSGGLTPAEAEQSAASSEDRRAQLVLTLENICEYTPCCSSLYVLFSSTFPDINPPL